MESLSQAHGATLYHPKFPTHLWPRNTPDSEKATKLGVGKLVRRRVVCSAAWSTQSRQISWEKEDLDDLRALRPCKPLGTRVCREGGVEGQAGASELHVLTGEWLGVISGTEVGSQGPGGTK